MPRNGAGTYSLPAGNPVVTGTVISSTVQNDTMSDVATALTNSIAKDGQTTPTANLPMGGYKLTGLGAGTTTTDSTRVDAVQDADYTYLSSVAGTNTVTASASPTPDAYKVGQIFHLIPANTNTGATTLNISSLGAGAVRWNGAALTGGELTQNVPVLAQVTAATPVFEILSFSPNTVARTLLAQTTQAAMQQTGLGLQAGNPNFLINSSFAIAQQGTTFTSTTNPANNDDAYTFDQWILLSDGNDIVDISQTAPASNVDVTTPWGVTFDIETANKKFAYMQILSNDKTKALFQQAGGVVSAAITIDVSDTGSFGNMRLYILSWQGTADSVTSDVVSAWGSGTTQPTWIANITEEGNLSITPSTTRTRFKLENVAIDTASMKNLIFILVNNDDTTTLTHTCTISAPKLEPGAVCTPYLAKSYEQELDECLYYFWRKNRNATNEPIAAGGNLATTTAAVFCPFPKPMRTVPTLLVSNVADFAVIDTGAISATTGLTISAAGTSSAYLAPIDSGAGFTDAAGCVLVFDSTAGGFIAFDARL